MFGAGGQAPWKIHPPHHWCSMSRFQRCCCQGQPSAYRVWPSSCEGLAKRFCCMVAMWIHNYVIHAITGTSAIIYYFLSFAASQRVHWLGWIGPSKTWASLGACRGRPLGERWNPSHSTSLRRKIWMNPTPLNWSKTHHLLSNGWWEGIKFQGWNTSFFALFPLQVINS